MKRKRNCGSTVVEFSLLVPIFVGLIYFYILLFLFLHQSGRKMDLMTQKMYQSEQEREQKGESFSDGSKMQTEGEKEIWIVEEQEGLFDIRIEMRKDTNDPVKNIRRWKLLADLF